MPQMQLFTQAEIATMRDRTKARNYSPERDAFRRDHERRRAWGKQQRHAERLRLRRDGALIPHDGFLVHRRPDPPTETPTAQHQTRPKVTPNT